MAQGWVRRLLGEPETAHKPWTKSHDDTVLYWLVGLAVASILLKLGVRYYQAKQADVKVIVLHLQR